MVARRRGGRVRALGRRERMMTGAAAGMENLSSRLPHNTGGMSNNPTVTGGTSTKRALCAAAIGLVAALGALISTHAPTISFLPMAAAQPGPAPPVELNPSILVLGTFDYVPYQTSPPFTSRCTDMVDRSLQRAGGTRLAWVPTVYWTSSKADMSDVTGYCYMDGDGSKGPPNCVPVTKELINQFREGLQLCAQLASDVGTNELAIVPHLDSQSRTNAAWRNAISFDPLAKYNGFTYEEVLLNPIADAFGAVVKPFTKIHYALQGEMSATVARYPRSYLDLIERVRARVVRAAAAAGVTLPPKQVHIGLSWNYNKLELDGLRPPSALLISQAQSATGVSTQPKAPSSTATVTQTGGLSMDALRTAIAGKAPADTVAMVPGAASRAPAAAAPAPAAPAATNGAAVAAPPTVVQASGPSDSGDASGGRRALHQVVTNVLSTLRPPAQAVPAPATILTLGGAIPPVAPAPAAAPVPAAAPAPTAATPAAPTPAAATPPTTPAAAPAPTAATPAAPTPAAATPLTPTPAAAIPAALTPAAATEATAATSTAPPAPAPQAAATPVAAPAPAAGSIPAAIAQQQSAGGVLDIGTLAQLLSKCDFIGISAYAALTADFTMNNLQNSAFTFFREFKGATGLDLDLIMQSQNIPLHYSEFGLGGGMSMDGTSVATTASDTALRPFFGVYPGLYNEGADPWRNPDVRSFMITFWQKTLAWLTQGGGPTYYIEACFMWTKGSYDILAVYPESTNLATGGSFLVSEVAQAIKAHNTQTAAVNRQLMLAGTQTITASG